MVLNQVRFEKYFNSFRTQNEILGKAQFCGLVIVNTLFHGNRQKRKSSNIITQVSWQYDKCQSFIFRAMMQGSERSRSLISERLQIAQKLIWICSYERFT